jgi:DNA (cytosine-5)-methyltransferase 1
MHGDIGDLAALPQADVILAGFPCQDLSAVGPRVGITGQRSALVGKLFDLIELASKRPDWVVLENVPFMLQLHRGAAMAYVINSLERLGYAWAYRVLDSRSFGLPQRRRRVFIVATRTNIDPANVLLADEVAPVEVETSPELAKGFYWTEGNTGLGWAVDAIPTLKGGSSLSIPSPPAIWLPDGDIRTPDIRDAERLQGLAANWTEPDAGKPLIHSRRRWRQVGNAVSVPVARWIAERIANPGQSLADRFRPLDSQAKWPSAAAGKNGDRKELAISEWPRKPDGVHLHEFLAYDPAPLSKRAAVGFYKRIFASSLRVEDGFLEAMAATAGVEVPSAADLQARANRQRAKPAELLRAA